MIDPRRITALNDMSEASGDYILYWMQNSHRAEFNPALELAVAEADRRRLPVVVGFGLTEDYPEANLRHYAFMLEGLAETRRTLLARGMGFVARRGSPDAVALDLARRAALVVCDCGYLRPQCQWRAHLAAKAGKRVLLVEGDAVVPVELVSNKAEIGARTLRPKLLRLRDEFLQPLPSGRPRASAERLDIASDIDFADPDAVLARLRIDRRVPPVKTFRGGYDEARRRLDDFIAQRLDRYASDRAAPGAATVSALSPYLHFGQISPVEIALAMRAAPAASESRLSYLEELIVRRELAMNFVYTTPDYDRYDCLPQWARHSLAAHRRDRREHVYDFEQLARADTHDPYWNAAMQEMLLTGYMPDYMLGTVPGASFLSS
jgi:deoxyribodipyrimidine photo-lyase